MTPKGKLIAIGGNEDKGNGDGDRSLYKHDFIESGILSRVVQEIGGAHKRMAVVTSASSIPKEVGRNYVEAFAKLGLVNVDVLDIRDRETAQRREMTDLLERADGVMLSGGNQLKITTVLGGTEFHKILKDRYMHEDGFVIAGTSAGAMCMSNTMIYEGHSRTGLIKGGVKMTTGLALVSEVIIDSHFVNRGRFSRLTQTVAGNPSAIGIGLGEDTGVVITGGEHLETIGSGQVIIFDGHEIRHSNIADVEEGQPISIENMIVHIISHGYHYDVRKRSFSAPVAEAT